MNLISALENGFPIKNKFVSPIILSGKEAHSQIIFAMDNKCYFFTFSDSKDYYYVKINGTPYIFLKRDVVLLYPSFISVYDCIRIIDKEESKKSISDIDSKNNHLFYYLMADINLLSDIINRNIEIRNDINVELNYIEVMKGESIERCYLGNTTSMIFMVSDSKRVKNTLKNLLKCKYGLTNQ